VIEKKKVSESVGSSKTKSSYVNVNMLVKHLMIIKPCNNIIYFAENFNNVMNQIIFTVSFLVAAESKSFRYLKSGGPLPTMPPMPPTPQIDWPALFPQAVPEMDVHAYSGR
jgi:hypothetical protein